MAKKSKSKSSATGKRTIPIDWTKAQGGGAIRYKPGWRKSKILKAKFERAKEKNTPCISFTFQFLENPNRGKKLVERIWLTDKSIYRLRFIHKALGLKVPKKKGNINLDKYEGKELAIEVVDDVDESGKYSTKSTVSKEGFMSLEEYENADLDEDDDDEEEDDDEELDEDELDEEEEDEEDDDDDEEDDDEEDDDDLDDM